MNIIAGHLHTWVWVARILCHLLVKIMNSLQTVLCPGVSSHLYNLVVHVMHGVNQGDVQVLQCDGYYITVWDATVYIVETHNDVYTAYTQLAYIC